MWFVKKIQVRIIIMTVVFSVIFPGNLQYFPSFLRSLENQTNKDFMLILFNDGVVDVEKYLHDTSLLFESYDVSGVTPFEIRLIGLQKILSFGAEYVVFADTDDLLSPERLDLSIKYLNKYPFVCNDISLMASDETMIKESYWSKRISNCTEFDINYIKNYNIIGLGNSAMQCRLLPSMLEKLKGYKSGNDWLFFSAAGKNLNAVFLSICTTSYRQHTDNLIGKKKVTAATLLTLIKNKIEHYISLNKMNFREYQIEEQIKINQHILRQCNDNQKFLELQAEKINSLGINFFWWEESNYIN